MYHSPPNEAAAETHPAPPPEPPATATAADLLARLLDDPTVPVSRKAQLASSLRSFADKLGQPLSDIPATAQDLRAALRTLHPRTAGVTAKRLANMRSDIQWIWRHYDVPKRPAMDPMTPVWAALFEQGDRRIRYGLSRFIRFLSSEGATPDAVADSHLVAYRRWLEQGQICKDPARLVRLAANAWNLAVNTIPGWPQCLLTVPKAREPYCLPWEDLPHSLRAEAEAWLARLAQADPTDLEAPARPLRPASLQARRFSLLQAISGMVHEGVAVADLTDLAAVVTPANAVKAISFLFKRAGDQPSAQAATVAGLLLMIARHWVKAPEDELQRLRRIQAKASPKNHGMTQRNRRRLNQFDSQRNVAAMLLLPEGITRALPKAGPLSFEAAHRLQTALAIELLLMVPIRRANLAGLHLDRHLIRQGDGRQVQWTLAIPSHEVKNREPIEAQLPGETARLLDLYLRRGRPVLNKSAGRWLFPGSTSERPKCPDVLLRQVQRLVRDQLGLDITLHFFRSLAGMLFLNERPGEYETVRRLLAHRQLETTVRHYVGSEAKAAMRRVDAVILGLRQQVREQSGSAPGMGRKRP